MARSTITMGLVACARIDGSGNERATKENARGETHSYNDAFYVWADPAATCGLPATVAPIGHSPAGLPIGVQIIGPNLEDRTTIAFSGMIKREFGGFAPPPGYAG
jgi:amidase